MAPRPPTKRQTQGQASRDAILVAAMRLMSDKGYDAMSIAELSAASGLPASSIYWHFKSKRGVLAAVLEAAGEEYFAEFSPPEHLGPVPPRQRMRAALGHAARALEKHRDFGRLRILLILVDSGDGPERDIILHVRHRSREFYWLSIQQTFAEHGDEVSAMVADELVDFGQSMFDGAFIATLYDPDLSLASLLDMTADAILALGDQVVADRRAA